MQLVGDEISLRCENEVEEHAMINHVICPETEQVVEVEGVETPLGVLITSCSRVRSPCRLACARTCATQLESKQRDHVHDTEPCMEVPPMPDLIGFEPS
jgi:hypothetical protein